VKTKHYIISMLFSILFGFFIIEITKQGYENIIVRYPNRKELQKQVRYLKDSTEDDYYRKNLEKYYFFEHSKIVNE
jgi:hypothetical protein